jgi:hypothetical protein
MLVLCCDERGLTDVPSDLQIFPKGLHYLEGGVATGFTHVEEGAHKTVLLSVKVCL